MPFRAFCRAIALPLAVVMLLVSGPATAAHAAMVTTEEVVSVDQAQDERARLTDFLAREDVRQEMMALGVDPAEAEARVAALSDAEVANIAGKLGDMEAGQGVGAIVGAIVLIFLVLLVTDLLCLTKVFNFTRCAR